MQRKLTKNFRRINRKKLTTNSVAETRFFATLKKELKKQLHISENPTIDETLAALNKIDLSHITKMASRLGLDVFKKNRKGFESILTALSVGLVTEQQIKQREKEEVLFKKALPSLIKEKEIYKPYLDKFNSNMQLIKNLPTDVEKELKKAYLKGEGFRGQDIEDYLINRMGKRARVIIRTESAKLNEALIEVRSASLGIKGYIWSTSEDARVRPSHKMVDGVFFLFKNPPTLDKMRGNCGEFPNCRCIAISVFSLEDIKFPVRVGENLVIDSKYDKKTKKSTAHITSGKITTYNKAEFIEKYNIRD